MGIFDGILIMSDLDGTLLDSQKLVSARNRAAIERFTRGGGLFTFATGRSLPAVAHLLDGVSVNAPAVLGNGCHGYDFARGQTVYEWCIGACAPELAQDIAREVPDCGVEIHTPRGTFVAWPNEYTARHFARTKMPYIERTPNEIELPWHKVCLLGAPEKMPGIIDYIERRFPGEFFLQLSGAYFLEVQAPNTDKGAGALEICRLLGISREKLFAVGDGANDVELLHAAARAFAPANARPEILALEPVLLPSNNESCIEAMIDIIEKEFCI